jgi:hypothetical protein
MASSRSELVRRAVTSTSDRLGRVWSGSTHLTCLGATMRGSPVNWQAIRFSPSAHNEDSKVKSALCEQ